MDHGRWITRRRLLRNAGSGAGALALAGVDLDEGRVVEAKGAGRLQVLLGGVVAAEFHFDDFERGGFAGFSRGLKAA